MTQDELKLVFDALKQCTTYAFAGGLGVRATAHTNALAILEKALAQPEQEPVAAYGYCPECGEKGVMRERRPNGNDKCANGHTYPSSKSTPPQPEQEPVGFAGVKIWVGNQQVVKLLTQTELDRAIEPCGLLEQAAEMCIEELKEVNT